MLKTYYQDEEEDMYWAEQQLELIEKIGLQNWLNMQV
jgi:bacterioferritin